MTQSSTIPWAPFSEVHKRYIHKGIGCYMSVAEGAVRAGKTIDNCIIAAAYLETCKDKFHLVSGSTLPNAKLNVGACNGFGLENLFRGRCRWGKYLSNEALYIKTKTGEKIVIFTGGGKRDSYKSILGNSYGLWIATEVNEHYDSDDSRESFIKVAFARQRAATIPKVLWDLNPCYPSHRIYTEYIDVYTKNGLPGGFQWQHFTIFDNLSVSEETMRTTLAMYVPGSIWYQRDIEGKRVRAEGLIYRQLAERIGEHLTKQPTYDYITLGVDIGGNGSKHTFVASGMRSSGRGFVSLMAHVVPATGTTPEDIYRNFGEFLERVEAKYGRVGTIYWESAEQVFLNGARERWPYLDFRNSIKNQVLHRIRGFSMIATTVEGWSYTSDCEVLVAAICEQVWHPKHPDERLDDGTTDVDTMDAFEYSWEHQIVDLIRS